MKIKIIPGMILITLSSLSVAGGNPDSAGDLSRRSLSAPPGPLLQTVAPSPAAASPGGAYNPWLTLSLLEKRLLSQDLGAWARSQGMRLLWNSRRDYLIYSTIRLSGRQRDEVLDQLGQLFRSENYGLVIRLYEKNNVLVIDDQ